MRLIDVMEKKTKVTDGLFVGLKISQYDEDKIIEMVNEMGVPNPITKDSIHFTLLRSKKPITDYAPLEQTDMWAYPKDFEIFEGRNGSNFLVLMMESEDIERRHLSLVEKHNVEPDMFEFKPHLTLSFDLEDFCRFRNKKTVLENIKEKYAKLLPTEVHIDKEYNEPLVLNWKPKK